MVHFWFRITDIRQPQFIKIGTFLKTSSCELLKNFFSSIIFLQDRDCFWRDIFLKMIFRTPSKNKNQLKDFEIYVFKLPMLKFWSNQSWWRKKCCIPNFGEIFRRILELLWLKGVLKPPLLVGWSVVRLVSRSIKKMSKMVKN